MWKFANYVYKVALAVDQLGNVTCQDIFNHTLVKTKKDFHAFGDEDDTISYCLAMNQKKDTLSKFGKFWAWFLDIVDSKNGGHMQKTLKMKIKRDTEACQRLN